MTIQRRTYCANKPEYESDYASTDYDLANLGVSIYREANSNQLDEAIHEIGNNCPSYIISKRGEERQLPPAINILETHEARRIFCLGNTAIQNLGDLLYCNVPSLHTILKVEPDDVELFGWENSPNRVIGVTIKDPVLSQIQQERSDIIENLNYLTYREADEYSYIKAKKLHISLARINPNTPKYVINKTLDAVRETLPSQVILKRAVIYNPATKKT